MLGTMRFYFRGGDARVRGMVDLASAFSALIIED